MKDLKRFQILFVACGLMLALTTGMAFGQVFVRPPVLVDTNTVTEAWSPSIDSDGDFTVVAWNADNQVWVSTSDGRGLTWSAPIRVDADATGAGKRTDSNTVKVVGNHIYVLWKDERNGGTSYRDLYFNASHDGGATWLGEQWINKGYAAGVGSVRDQSLAASAVLSMPDHVYVLVSVDPTASSPNEELYLLTSTDAGVSFGAPVFVPQGSLPGAFDIDYVSMDAEGVQASIIWHENRFGSNDDVYFNATLDGGITWMHAADYPLQTNGPAASDVDYEVFLSQRGPTLIGVWQDERSGANEELRCNVSLDAGVTWMPADVLIGSYIPGGADVDSPEAFVCANGNLLATWEDNTTGSDEIYVAVSTDNGLTWTDFQASASGAGYPAFEGAGDVAGVTWTGGTSGAEVAEALFTQDGGATWSSAFTVSNNTGDVDYAEIGYNALYNNFITPYLCDDNGTNNVYVAGFRPQTLTCNGPFTAKSPVNFSVSNWAGPDTLFVVLMTGGAGNLPISDGRNVGIQWDVYTNASMTLLTWFFLGPISTGSGSTTPFPWFSKNAVAPGTVIYNVAVGIDPVASNPVGMITDLVPFTVQ